MKKIILTGIQPSGDLHLGNYLGTIQNWNKYIEDYECYFFIADLHSLTENYNPKEKKSQILTLAAEILALGLDPQKCTFFIQSDIKEHVELNWILNCVTPISFLERMTQYKDKSAKQIGNINVGLFSYPVLMAADILMYDTDLVPVGEDQTQHVELARDAARFFNNRFGETFKLPKDKMTESKRIMSLLEPAKKMSKSSGEKSCIFISDEPESISQKIRKAVADEKGLENLYDLGGIFIKDFNEPNYRNNNLKLKEDLAAGISDHFVDFRKERKKWLGKEKEILKILEKGAEKARAVATKKMEVVRKRVGLI